MVEGGLFSFSLGSMRPFGALAMELISMAVPMVRGIAMGDWSQDITREARPLEEVLRLWDESTEEINRLWPQIPVQRFQDTAMAFGQYEGSCTTSCSTSSIMRSITVARATSTCVLSASSHRPSTSDTDRSCGYSTRSKKMFEIPSSMGSETPGRFTS